MSSRFNHAAMGPGSIRSAASRTGLALIAAAFAACFTPGASAAINDITSLTTSMTTASSVTKTSLSGYGASYSIYKTADNYNLDYNGQDDAVKTVTAGSLGTYTVGSTLGTVTVRRASTGGDNDTVWYAGTGTGTNNSTVVLDGTLVTGFNQALSSNNLMMGADNVFSNMGNAVGNNTNVDRIDVQYSAFKASTAEAFTVMDRGPTNDHDAFKIAAITAIGANGAPSAYGPLISFTDGTWGHTSLVVPTQEENIVRENDSTSSPTFHPSDSTAQSIGGVLIQSSSLVAPGTTIYGYSLFAANVAGSGSELVDWTNTTYFPAADSTSTGGGLDPVATLAGLYTPVTAVPEPATCTLLAATAMGGTLARRPKRKTV